MHLPTETKAQVSLPKYKRLPKSTEAFFYAYYFYTNEEIDWQSQFELRIHCNDY